MQNVYSMYSEDLISIHLLAEKKKIMEKSEIETLIQELNKLSEFEKQNLARMKEIAHVLVAYYMWWKQWSVKSVEKKSKKGTTDKDTASDVET